MLFLVNPFQTFKFPVLIIMSNIAFETTPSQTSLMIECYWLKITPATQTPNRSPNGGFAFPSSAGASLCALCWKEVGERENARGGRWEEGAFSLFPSYTTWWPKCSGRGETSFYLQTVATNNYVITRELKAFCLNFDKIGPICLGQVKNLEW